MVETVGTLDGRTLDREREVPKEYSYVDLVWPVTGVCGHVTSRTMRTTIGVVGATHGVEDWTAAPTLRQLTAGKIFCLDFDEHIECVTDLD